MDPDLSQDDLAVAKGRLSPDDADEAGSDAPSSPSADWLLDGYVPI